MSLLHRLIHLIILSIKIPGTGAFAKKASRSARLNLHRPPMIRPSVSPRCTYSRIGRELRRNTSAASRKMCKRSPIGEASVPDFLRVLILWLPRRCHRLRPLSRGLAPQENTDFVFRLPKLPSLESDLKGQAVAARALSELWPRSQ